MLNPTTKDSTQETSMSKETGGTWGAEATTAPINLNPPMLPLFSASHGQNR
jgi:hypothetical protein